jgi:hypothetical protein
MLLIWDLVLISVLSLLALLTAQTNGQDCVADEYAHGEWVQSVPGSCSSWLFRNETCGPDFDMSKFCSALRCRSLLVVGSSLAEESFLSLAAEAQKKSSDNNKAHRKLVRVYKNCDITRIPICQAECPTKAVHLSYVRSDHLTKTHRFGRDPNSNCPFLKYIDNHEVLLLSTGAHMTDIVRVSPDVSFNEGLAEKLSNDLRDYKGLTIFSREHWGVLEYHPTCDNPIERPVPIADKWGWQSIPAVTAIYGKVLKNANSNNTFVINPAPAMALRPDSRKDFLHFKNLNMYLATTWRMVQSVLAQNKV